MYHSRSSIKDVSLLVYIAFSYGVIEVIGTTGCDLASSSILVTALLSLSVLGCDCCAEFLFFLLCRCGLAFPMTGALILNSPSFCVYVYI